VNAQYPLDRRGVVSEDIDNVPQRRAGRNQSSDICAAPSSWERDPGFERNVAKLHAQGPRALAEMLIHLGIETMQGTTIDQMVEKYAQLDPAIVKALDGDRFAPLPALRIVARRRP
jgi:hypothetical protein